jgi:hypothetical protein
MKRVFTITALTLVFFVLSAAPARAQHGYTIEKQVKFAGNKTSVSYKSRLSNRLETHTYHLKAEKGKTLWVQLIAKNLEMTFQIFDAQDNEIGNPADEDWYWEGKLAASGEYTILVQTPRGAGNYTLNIKLN